MGNTPNGSDFDKRSMISSLPALQNLGKKDKQRSEKKTIEETLFPISIEFRPSDKRTKYLYWIVPAINPGLIQEYE